MVNAIMAQLDSAHVIRRALLTLDVYVVLHLQNWPFWGRCNYIHNCNRLGLFKQSKSK
jgi:hypothetical protein